MKMKAVCTRAGVRHANPHAGKLRYIAIRTPARHEVHSRAYRVRRRADAHGEDMGVIGTIRFIHDYYAHIHLLMRATALKFSESSSLGALRR